MDDGAARKLNLLGRIAFWAFLLIVILAPLPFGANRPWSWSLLSLLLGCGDLALGGRRKCSTEDGSRCR